jgi:5-(carboxyamino)imidazole ribonucleotide synthase
MSQDSGSNTKDVGILGGGQLGCMLADAALALGLEPRLFAEAGSPAAALYPGRTTIGSVSDAQALRGFFAQVRIIAFENEFLDCSLLEHAAKGLSLRFGPGLNAIRELQDKLRQKEILTRLGLPTAEYLALQPAGDAQAFVREAFERLQGEAVFKWSRLGYDGKGVLLASSSEAGRREALEFCERSLSRDIAVYAERKIAFRRELAVVACRSIRGKFAAYPLVISEQERGICKRVFGPARALGVSTELETEAQECARRLAEAMGLEGAFALELFETPEGKLSINEIAPRVHNTGHYSQDACPSSQFENHWRALLGLELGDTRVRDACFGMLNLLGPEEIALSVPQRRDHLPFPEAPAPLVLHWYAKGEVRPRRKVGHLNGVVPGAGQIPELSRLFEDYQTRWTEKLRELQERKRHA